MIGAAGSLREERGQAVVELACVVPVVLACALIVVNLGVYIERCSRLDRAAPDMVLAHGVSPAQEQNAASAVRQVREALVEAMGDDDLEIDVRMERLDAEESGLFPSFSPGRVRFVCSMGFRPRPATLSVAGVAWTAPVLLVHERSLVVDVGTVAGGV
ncbi:hypothetical protein AAK967_07235 [Atopobiaceae bacterium 24-176]